MSEIREIESDEYGFLREMLFEALFVSDGEDPFSQTILNDPHLRKYVDNFGKAGDIAFVLIQNDEPVGAIWSRLFTADDPGYGFVDEKTPEFSVAIRKQFRNNGFGTRLIQNLLQRLAYEDYEKVSLSVDCRSPAKNLYDRLGFGIVAEAGSSVTMVKHLSVNK